MECPQRCAWIALFVVGFAASAVVAQDGAVGSGAPGSPAAPAAADPKALPWKFLAGPGGVLDSAQEVTIRAFANPATWDCDKNRRCAVEQFIQSTLGGSLRANLETAKAKYVVLHVADYGAADGTKIPDAWYLYRSMGSNWGDPKWNYSKFTGQRIYGAPSVLFLFVHLHAKAVSMTDAKNQLRTAIQRMATDPSTASLSRASSSLSDAQMEQALKSGTLSVSNPDDAKLPFNITIREKDTGAQLQWLGDSGVPSTYANVHYEAAVVKRTPANVEDLISVLKILGHATAKTTSIELETKSVIVWGAGQIDKIGLPSDVTIAGYNIKAGDAMKDEDRPTLQIGTLGAFNDEQLYWWDASIGIPVHKIKDLQYSSSNNTVVASQVDRQSAYAMFNLMLHPVDLSEPRDNVWPRILVGFPITSSPWDKLFAGGAIGLPFKPLRNFQFFAGATFNRTKHPATLAAGSTATDAQLQNDLRLQTAPKFTFGINVPVKSVLDKLLP